MKRVRGVGDDRKISGKEVQVGVEWVVKKTLREGVMRIGDEKKNMERRRQ